MRGLAVKGFYKIFIIVCFFVFSLLFLTSISQGYYSPYQSQYQSPPINININLGGFPGGYPMGNTNYLPFMGSGYAGGTDPYGNKWMTVLPPTPESIKAARAKFSFIQSAADDGYIYVGFGETKGKGREALAIFETSGSDDCEYLSHITLGDDTRPAKIIVQGDLLVIGEMDEGTVYLVDVSDKEDPELINKLVLGRKYQSGGRSGVTGMAIEDKVLFVSIEFLGSDKHIIYSLDISDPDDTDEDDDLLDSYILDDDDYQEIYNMVSVPDSDYLYISGRYKYDPTILVMDISEPGDLSLVETLDMEGDDEVSVAINGDYLLATVQVEDFAGPFDDGACEFKVIDISAPEDPEIIASSEEFSGRHILCYKNMVIKDNYAYVFVTTRDPTETKIYVFDISNPEDPDLVEKSRSIDGYGTGLYFVGDRLGLHTDQIITMFDISDPEELSVDETVDIHDILEDELDGWGVDRSSSSYYGGYPGGYPQYGLSGYSGWGSYGGYGGSGSYGYGGPSYGGYGGYGLGGYSGWGGPTYGPTYDGGPYGYSGWGGPTYGPTYDGGPYGYSGWGGPTYGGYGPGWGGPPYSYSGSGWWGGSW